MKTIFLISPEYLDDLFNESEKYSFAIQGYGNAERAKKGLLYVNASEILGFAVLYEAMPSPESDRFRSLMEFIEKCNLLKANKKFVVVSRGPVNLGDLKRFEFLNFDIFQNVDYVTDTLINKSIYGNILLANYEPYLLKPAKKESISEMNSPVLSYSPVVPVSVTDVFERVDKLDTFEDTVNFDKVMNRYKEVNEVVCGLRELLIAKDFGIAREDLLLKVVGELSELEGELKNWYLTCLYKIGGKMV